ncbi:MAG: hypothetical protein LBC27_06270 [Spirochaetaceae bacterium]|jgi:hypothetical protein|nr:hypothetical protein [Spirochaetaceae bacterium]
MKIIFPPCLLQRKEPWFTFITSIRVGAGIAGRTAIEPLKAVSLNSLSLRSAQTQKDQRACALARATGL